MKKVYPDVPELDWLKRAISYDFEHSDDCALAIGGPCDCWMCGLADEMHNIYKYLLWDRRFKSSTPQSDLWLIAFGFVRKYYHLVFNVPMNEQDKKTVAISEEQYRKLRRGEKLT